MRSYRNLCALAALCIAIPVHGAAQCSDAGICSIGGGDELTHVLTLSASLSHGVSRDDEYTFTDLHLGMQAVPMEGVHVAISAPFRSTAGPLGSTSGLGDLLVTGQLTVWAEDGLSVAMEGGLRFATGDVNQQLLPQAYQPGLGTTDALAGVTFAGVGWSASIGYQYAPGRSDNVVNRLRRGDDVSLRGTYTIVDTEVRVRAEAILIHKLRRSDGLVPTPASSSIAVTSGPIPDTDRTQVNLVGDITYPLAGGISLNARGAIAMLARPVNIDGLKRNITIEAGISIPVL